MTRDARRDLWRRGRRDRGAAWPRTNASVRSRRGRRRARRAATRRVAGSRRPREETYCAQPLSHAVVRHPDCRGRGAALRVAPRCTAVHPPTGHRGWVLAAVPRVEMRWSVIVELHLDVLRADARTRTGDPFITSEVRGCPNRCICRYFVRSLFARMCANCGTSWSPCSAGVPWHHGQLGRRRREPPPSSRRAC